MLLLSWCLGGKAVGLGALVVKAPSAVQLAFRTSWGAKTTGTSRPQSHFKSATPSRTMKTTLPQSHFFWISWTVSVAGMIWRLLSA